ncbi:MAG TPA: hypothetical protein VKB49_25765, partial [Candidatus Sulfotelmatobacter sp.]|nr:hypothetical protein [Candidatus Sulfotelmatobacter sp.]
IRTPVSMLARSGSQAVIHRTGQCAWSRSASNPTGVRAAVEENRAQALKGIHRRTLDAAL